MPNWVQCRVIGKDSQALYNALVNEKEEVDFNKVIPMSEDLKITSGGGSYFAPSPFGFFQSELLEKQKPLDTVLDSYYDSNITQDKFVKKCMKDVDLKNKVITIKGFTTSDAKEYLETFFKGAFNYRRYGHADWYNWSCDVWGTKWNASETIVCGDGSIEFQTAWCMPEGVFRELAKITPIRVIYADEDMGSNCGIVDFFVNKEGEVEEVQLCDSSINLAIYAWGYDFDSYYETYYEDEENAEELMDKGREEYYKEERYFADLMNTSTLDMDYATV